MDGEELDLEPLEFELEETEDVADVEEEVDDEVEEEAEEEAETTSSKNR